MADALVSAPVAITAGAVAATLIIISANKVAKSTREGNVPLMGVLGAFVFAAQMINFTIPGTGSSGHIIGGILLSALLGPWSGFLTLCSVLIVQCLVFADGGIMALGCNILNMAAVSCLVAYPLIYKPIAGRGKSTPAKLMLASVLACVVGLELGAIGVSLETVASGITALPFSQFLLIMVSIHLVIGAVEGVATGMVLAFVWRNSPDLLMPGHEEPTAAMRRRNRTTILAFAALAVVFAIGFVWLASENPDGLEWSIERIYGATELAPAEVPPTAFMADYGSHLSGIVGGLIVMSLLWAGLVIGRRLKPSKEKAR